MHGLRRRKSFYRLSSVLVIFHFLASLIFPIPGQAQLISNLPPPGTLVTTSPAFSPAILKGITVNPENPLLFDFLVDLGDSGLKGEAISPEAERLIKFFLTALTVPDEEVWVNLSPYEEDMVIPSALGVTEMGKDMLSQDYMLKQLTASLTNPEQALGKKFWDRVYQKAAQTYGTTNFPINTFNKVWIIPDEALVVQDGASAFVAQCHLKVMLESDYLALVENLDNDRIGTDRLDGKKAEGLNNISSAIVREIILPELEKEVNEGQNFGAVRQIFNSVILATWYKRALKESLLGKIYMDQNKVAGVDVDDKDIKQKIYDQYMAAFKEGVYNLIKEDYDLSSKQAMPRRYFSGGLAYDASKVRGVDRAMLSRLPERQRAEVSRFQKSVVDNSRSVADGADPRLVTIGTRFAEQEDEAGALRAAARRPSGGDRAMLAAPVKAKLPASVQPNVPLIETDNRYTDIVTKLTELGEADNLFAKWDPPGVNDDKKRGVLDQLIELDGSYPGGLAGYKKNSSVLLAASAKRVNPLAGYTPEVPTGQQVGSITSPEFQELSEAGLRDANKMAMVMVAGGVGDRLGYKGIKVGIPLDLATEQVYIAKYAQTVKAIQGKSNRINGEDREIPFVIMTSDETHAQTVALLEQNRSFGLRGFSVNPTAEEVAAGNIGQIVILKQGMVPAVVNQEGQFVLESDNPYKLQVKPHGHGDVHSLIKKAGLTKAWKAKGTTHTVFFQDTNGQVVNAILPGLAVTKRDGMAMNFLTAPREPGEATGGIVDMVKDGQRTTMNVEYNELEPVLKDRGGDVADPKTKKSPYPANLNIFVVNNDVYDRKLDDTGGIFGEFINPKYKDDTKTAFAPARPESMMQDLAKGLAGEKVGFTVFDKRDVFSPVKNEVEKVLKELLPKGNYPDSMATGEADFYRFGRKMLASAGVKIDVDGTERSSLGVPYQDGAKVSISSSFATIPSEVGQKIRGGEVSTRSVLVLDGENITMEGVKLDGTLIVKAAPDVSVSIKNANISNDGWDYVDLTAAEMKSSDQEVPQTLKMRGYRIEKKGEQVFDLTQAESGHYEIGADMQARRVGPVLPITEINRVRKELDKPQQDLVVVSNDPAPVRNAVREQQAEQPLGQSAIVSVTVNLRDWTVGMLADKNVRENFMPGGAMHDMISAAAREYVVQADQRISSYGVRDEQRLADLETAQSMYQAAREASGTYNPAEDGYLEAIKTLKDSTSDADRLAKLRSVQQLYQSARQQSGTYSEDEDGYLAAIQQIENVKIPEKQARFARLQFGRDYTQKPEAPESVIREIESVMLREQGGARRDNLQSPANTLADVAKFSSATVILEGVDTNLAVDAKPETPQARPAQALQELLKVTRSAAPEAQVVVNVRPSADLPAVQELIAKNLNPAGSTRQVQTVDVSRTVADRAMLSDRGDIASTINYLFTGDAFLGEVVPVTSLIRFSINQIPEIPEPQRAVLKSHGLLDDSGNVPDVVREVATQFGGNFRRPDPAMLSETPGLTDASRELLEARILELETKIATGKFEKPAAVQAAADEVLLLRHSPRDGVQRRIRDLDLQQAAEDQRGDVKRVQEVGALVSMWEAVSNELAAPPVDRATNFKQILPRTAVVLSNGAVAPMDQVESIQRQLDILVGQNPSAVRELAAKANNPGHQIPPAVQKTLQGMQLMTDGDVPRVGPDIVNIVKAAVDDSGGQVRVVSPVDVKATEARQTSWPDSAMLAKPPAVVAQRIAYLDGELARLLPNQPIYDDLTTEREALQSRPVEAVQIKIRQLDAEIGQSERDGNLNGERQAKAERAQWQSAFAEIEREINPPRAAARLQPAVIERVAELEKQVNRPASSLTAAEKEQRPVLAAELKGLKEQPETVIPAKIDELTTTAAVARGGTRDELAATRATAALSKWQSAQAEVAKVAPSREARPGQPPRQALDRGMLGSRQDSRPDKLGGIDFNPKLFNLQIKRDDKGVPLPLPQQDIRTINIEGLYPVIINIAPATLQNVPFLLNLSSAENEVRISKN